MVGGAYYVSKLTNRVASSANIEFHARIVVQKFIARELIRVNTLAIQEAYSDETDIFDLQARESRELDEIIGDVTKRDVGIIGDAYHQYIKDQRLAIKNGTNGGVKCGIRPIDNFTNGWQKGDLIIQAGRPGMGKTSGALAIAYGTAKKGEPAAFFSLEVPKIAIVKKIIASESEIETSVVYNGKVDNDTLDLILRDNLALNNLPLYIDDTPSLSLLEFKSKARRLVTQLGVKLIVIDYLQLMTSGNPNMAANRELEISTISRGLKSIAKELNIPIIALSQLSRGVESRPSRKPQLSDLRESGAIEQDADMVIFWFRPWYYWGGEADAERLCYEYGNLMFPYKNLLVGIVAKNRNGSCGEFFLGFIDEYAKVTDYDLERMKPKFLPKGFEVTEQNNTFVQQPPLAANNDFLNQQGSDPAF